jgi:hypothetical protein
VPIIARTADTTDTVNGLCSAALNSGDTVPSGVAIEPGQYAFDVWTTDSNGNRLAQIVYMLWNWRPAVGLPGTPITPLPPQQAGSILQRWKYVTNGMEGTDFMVNLPTPYLDTNYGVNGDYNSAEVNVYCPVSSNTLTQFRCITTVAPTFGDVIIFTAGHF